MKDTDLVGRCEHERGPLRQVGPILTSLLDGGSLEIEVEFAGVQGWVDPSHPSVGTTLPEFRRVGVV